MSPARIFTMPDLGEGLTEAAILEWFVVLGDAVAVDQIVAEVETAKAVVELPCPFDGVVSTIFARPGVVVAVGEPILGVRVNDAEADDDGASFGADDADDATGEPTEKTSGPGEAGQSESSDASGAVLVGYGTGTEGAAVTWKPSTPTPDERATGGRTPAQDAPGPRMSPIVRKFARQNGVDPSHIRPTGAHGVITREDVERHLTGSAVLPSTDASEASSPTQKRTRMTPTRRAIADQMVKSKSQIPHATTWLDVDVTRVLRMIKQHNQSHEDSPLNLFAYVLRSCIPGLRQYPSLNATFDAETDEVVHYLGVDLGFAAATDTGLIVPVIRGAEKLSLAQIAHEVRELSDRARARSLSTKQLGGSTFTVSNYGSLGMVGAVPVINHPESAILGVGNSGLRPWIHKSVVKPRHVLQLSLSIDHRISDGMEAAGFLNHLAESLSNPVSLLAQS